MVKSPLHINNNSIHEIQCDRKLPPGVIPLNITHNLNHKHPSELLIPMLNISNKEVKIPRNTILGSINSIYDMDAIEEVSWQKMQNTEDEAVKNTAQNPQVHKLLLFSPRILIFRFMQMIVVSQLLCYKMLRFPKLQEGS